ncbi:MAG: alpha/beta hydrolase [Colwellia sp.]|nr:alpha/beta hydrolase [Colwellia sp.]
MPVWVKGNIDSGVFVIFNHGGPGSSGTLESIMEVNPANAQYGHKSPIKILEKEYAVVYWDQSVSGLSEGNADPNDSIPNDFGDDLSAVIDELNNRYTINSTFLIGQSWGHFVATNYLSSSSSWQSNQNKINGYIGYKGNHAQQMVFTISREKMLTSLNKKSHSEDVNLLEKIKFYSSREDLTDLTDFGLHYQYIHAEMKVAGSIFDRIYTSVKASVFSSFNGWAYSSNNKKTISASKFMHWVATNNTMENKIHRIEIPTLLLYGRHDLIAPVEVGQHILATISTPDSDKRLVVLEKSRHGAEYADIQLLQNEVIAFIEQYRQKP